MILKKRIDYVGLGVFVASFALFVSFCGSYGLWDPWETHYAEAARQIIERGDWWTLYWEDDFFFSKPILLFWLMAASFSLFGVTEFAARLPIALCAVAGVVAMYWGIASSTRSKLTGVFAATALATIPLYSFIARQCITDMPFVASMTIAMMAFVRYEMAPRGRPWHMYMVHIFCGFAVLAKGPLGVLLPGAVVLCYLLISTNWGCLRRAKILSGLVLFLLVAAPWYIAMLCLHGERFINEFFIYNNVKRATGVGVHGASFDFFYYLRRSVETDPDSGGHVLQVGTFPWLAVFPAAAFTYFVKHGRALIAYFRGKNDDSTSPQNLQLPLLLLCWAIVAFCVFSSIPTKFHHYLLPLAPPIAALAALWLADVAKKRVHVVISAIGCVIAAGIVLYVGELLAKSPGELLDLFTYNYGSPFLQRYDVGGIYRYGSWLMVAAFLMIALPFRWRFQSYLSASICVVSLGLTVFGIDRYVPQATECYSQAEAFERFEWQRRPGDQLIIWRMNNRGETFYGRSSGVSGLNATHLRWLLSKADRSFIVSRSSGFSRFSRDYQRVVGQPPNVLNTDACNFRMVLHDSPRVEPPEFEPPPGGRLSAVPDHVENRLENTRIGPDLSLIGFNVEWLNAGSNLQADVTLFLRCERETEEWWKVFLHGESSALPGRRSIRDHTAVSDSFPSVVWQPGDILVDRDRVNVGWVLDELDGQAEVGIYFGLFHDMTRAQVSPESAHDGENRIVIGRWDTRVIPEGSVLSGMDELDDDVDRLKDPIRFGDVATLVGTRTRVRRETSDQQPRAVVELFLRAESQTERDWMIFLHVSGQGNRREVSDHHPVAGRVRTSTWEVGQIYVDRVVFDIGRFDSQDIRIYGGLFSDNDRSPIEPSSSDVGDNRVLLGTFPN